MKLSLNTRPKQQGSFFDNYKALIAAMAFLLISIGADAQIHQSPTLWGKRESRHVTDSAWQGPTGNGLPSSSNITSRKQFGLYFDSTNYRFYIYSPKTNAWDTIHIGASTGSTNTSIGSAFRIAVNGTNNIKSIFFGWGAIGDSTTSGQVGVRVDSTTLKDVLWARRGNAGTNSLFDGIGTTDAQDLVIKTNNTEQLRLLSTGGIRIPTTVDSTIGVIFKGSDRFIHNYQNPAMSTTLGQSLYIGRKSGNFNFTGASGGFGTRNTAIGDSTLFANTTGYRNTAIGIWAGAANTTGFEHTVVGANSLERNTTGRQNTAIGAISLQFNTTGERNVALGYSTLQFNTTGSRNTAIGGRAMQNSSAGFANVAVGFDALAYNTIGDHNTAMGLDALYYSDGTHNTAIGDSALWGLYPSFGPPDQKHMGYKNTAIGSRAGYHLGDTYPNFASVFDTAVTFLGGNASRDSSIPYTTSLKNMTVIGYNARGFASNQVVLGNNDVTSTLLKGSINARGYGAGARTGTPATYPAFNASGDLIESATPYTTTPTWQQTLTAGSTLNAISNTVVIPSSGQLSFNIGASSSWFAVNNSTGASRFVVNTLGIAGYSPNQLNLIQTTNQDINLTAYRVVDGGVHLSRLVIDTTKIVLEPYLGNFQIDSLNAQSNASDSMMVWATSGANRGKVGYRAIPTGGGSGTVNSGTANRIAYYATTGTAISEAAAITASRALISDANGVPTHSTTTATELGYVSGVTSAIQTQLGTKISALAAVGSTPNANGATISGVTLNLQPASSAQPGVVIAGAQDFGGYKDFYTFSPGGAAMGIRNTSATGFSGIEYKNETGTVITFTGQNNANNEYRFNNIGSGGIINFMIGSVAKMAINNGGTVGIVDGLYIGSTTTTPTTKLQVAGRFAANQGADVASAAGAIALGTDGNSFEITGTNAITLISNSSWVNGSEVTLLFTSTATLTDGTANSGTDIGMELAGNVNFVASAGATLKLILSEIGGTQRWREISRSVQ